MARALNLVGQRFDKLIVIRLWDQPDGKGRLWLCQCDCGNQTVARGATLRARGKKSCGCRRIDVSSTLTLTHGLTNSAAYHRHAAMINRCTNPNCTRYKDYGGRGIKVCAGYHQFEFFFVRLGHPPEGQVLDRQNNNGHYSCGECFECLANGWVSNVHWIPRKLSNRNSRKTTSITYKGQTHSLPEWAEITGIPYMRLLERYWRRYPLEKLFSKVHLRWGTPLATNQTHAIL